MLESGILIMDVDLIFSMFYIVKVATLTSKGMSAAFMSREMEG